MSSRRRLALLCCATGLALSACGSGASDAPSAAANSAAPATAAPATESSSTESSAAASSTSPTASSEPAAAVPASLQFSAPLVGGGSFDGASVAGTPVVFWFWAPG